jgi:hypothetical protein
MARRPKPVSPLEKAEWWALALKRALQQPTVTKAGCVRFKARIVAPKGQPVSSMSRCEKLLKSGEWDLKDAITVATALHGWIRDGQS